MSTAVKTAIMEGTTAAADDTACTAGADVVDDEVTEARLPPAAFKWVLKVAALTVIAVLRVLAPVAAIVSLVVWTWNSTATSLRVDDRIVTSLAMH